MKKLENIRKTQGARLVFLLLSIQLLLCFVSVQVVHCSENSNGLEILEIFLQPPVNSTASNVDQLNQTFFALETVEIYANVSYGEMPQNNIIVAFEITGPEESPFPYIIIRTAKTNKTGTAHTSFTIPPSNSTNSTVGIWNVHGSAKILKETAYDTLSFEVYPSVWLMQTRELFILVIITTAVSTATPLGVFVRKRRKKQSQAVIQEPIVPEQPIETGGYSKVLVQTVPTVIEEPQTTIQEEPIIQNENVVYAPVPLQSPESVVDTIESLEREKATLVAEIAQLRMTAETRVITLRKEIAELRKEAQRLRKYKLDQ